MFVCLKLEPVQTISVGPPPLASLYMAFLPLSGEEHVAGQLTQSIPHTHDETAIPLDSTLRIPSTNSSHTANNNPLNSIPNVNSDHESVQHHSDKDVQYTPIRAGVDSGKTTLERTVSEMFRDLSADERVELKRIASSLQQSKTNQSREGSYLERQDTLAGVADDDPRIDPSRPEFDVYVWARAFVRALHEDIKAARAGFTFKKLNVSGMGSAVSLQSNVASILMAPLRLGEYVSFGKKPETAILRDFNGVVKSGEMLVVLGRPGSGCSTFLKTICGELSGLALNEDSVIHYNGFSY